jgi:hypothetical protein
MNFEDISRVNSEINMIDLKGKDYAMVPERVTAFRKLFPDGFIKTEIISHDGTTVVMQAIAGYYDNGVPIILGSGLAQETKGYGMVNKTSYIENCETSAVGRALGMIGLGINGGGICSAEELANAVTAQKQMKEAENAYCNPPMPENGPVQKSDKLPKNAQNTDKTVSDAFGSNMNEFMERFEITNSQEALKLFTDLRKKLFDAGVIKNNGKMKSVDEVNDTFDAIYKNCRPGDAA